MNDYYPVKPNKNSNTNMKRVFLVTVVGGVTSYLVTKYIQMDPIEMEGADGQWDENQGAEAYEDSFFIE